MKDVYIGWCSVSARPLWKYCDIILQMPVTQFSIKTCQKTYTCHMLLWLHNNAQGHNWCHRQGVWRALVHRNLYCGGHYTIQFMNNIHVAWLCTCHGSDCSLWSQTFLDTITLKMAWRLPNTRLSATFSSIQLQNVCPSHMEAWNHINVTSLVC